MNEVNPQLTGTKELVELLVALSGDANFQRLMDYFERRCTGLAVAGHLVLDNKMQSWISGRVQELQDLISIYNNREILVKAHSAPPQVPNHEL